MSTRIYYPMFMNLIRTSVRDNDAPTKREGRSATVRWDSFTYKGEATMEREEGRVLSLSDVGREACILASPENS